MNNFIVFGIWQYCNCKIVIYYFISIIIILLSCWTIFTSYVVLYPVEGSGTWTLISLSPSTVVVVVVYLQVYKFRIKIYKYLLFIFHNFIFGKKCF